MLKNDKFYTFLLARHSRSGIYIKRVAVKKSYLHFTSLGLFFALGLTAAGFAVTTLVRDPVLAASLSNPASTAFTAQKVLETAAPAQAPDATDLAVNSGGPEESNVIDGEDAEIDNAVAALRKASDPAYLPTMWAHLGKINNEFGFRRNPFGGRAYEFHPGMDIDGERGEEVIAPANGTVIKAGFTGGYGNMVEIDHGHGLTSRYGHMSRIEAEVGQTIKRGDLIGLIGSTGRSTGPHLHYELRLNDRSINPRHFLPPEPTDLSAIAK